MWISINVFIFLLIIILIGCIWKKYQINAFFDISFLYLFILFIAPSLLFFVNFLYFFIRDTSLIYYAFIPLIIPFSSLIIIKIKNYTGRKNYKILKNFSIEIVNIAKNNNLQINDRDVRIRIKKDKNVDFILNVYNNIDEKIVISLIKKFENRAKKNYRKFNINFLIDKKKNNSYTLQSL